MERVTIRAAVTREAAADEDPDWRDHGAARAAEIVGERLAQRFRAEDVGIAERRAGKVGASGAIVAEPFSARKQRRVGQPAEQSHQPARWGRPTPAEEQLLSVAPRLGAVRALLRVGLRAHACPASPSGLEVPVRGEVPVRLDDHAARNAEVGREHTGGREIGTRPQASLLDRRPQCLFEPLANAPATSGREVDQEVGRDAERLSGRGDAAGRPCGTMPIFSGICQRPIH
jgi:hypothetical protein